MSTEHANMKLTVAARSDGELVDVIGIPEILELIPIHLRTLRRWIKSGRLKPCGYLLGSAFFTRADVEREVAQHRETGPGPSA